MPGIAPPDHQPTRLGSAGHPQAVARRDVEPLQPAADAESGHPHDHRVDPTPVAPSDARVAVGGVPGGLEQAVVSRARAEHRRHPMRAAEAGLHAAGGQRPAAVK